MRPGDPLDVQSGDVQAIQRLLPRIATAYARAGEARASDDFVAGFIRGLGRRPKVRRQSWAAAILATAALVLTAFWAGRISATSRPAAVIPSGPWGAASTDQQRTGAPQFVTPTSTATGHVEASASAAVGGAPLPSQKLGDWSAGTNPDLTPEPERTPPATRSVLHGPGIGGLATWFAQAPYGTAAAGPRLRRFLGPNWRGTRVSVSLRVPPGMACNGCPPPVILVLTDWCACTPPNGPDRLIDLDDQAFAALAPLSFGVITVEVREVAP